MDSRSKDTLLAIEQNSNKVTCLKVGVHHLESGEGLFHSEESNEYDKLGTAIGNNTHLTNLEITNLYNNVTLDTTNKRFYNGIRRNSSITNLYLHAITFDGNDITDVAFEVLRACQEQNILTILHINTMPLVNSGEKLMADLLRGCTNIREITYIYSELTDDQLLPIVEAIRGHGLIEKLDLDNNNIGDTGCEALATLRNVRSLGIAANMDISNEGLISIVNSLPENKNLRELNYNWNDLRAVADNFCRALCNTSSINDIYSSNHTLESIKSSTFHAWEVFQGRVKLESLLKMNESTNNKRHVAIKKILLYYPNYYDMEPLFDLSMEGDDSGQDLRALPHVISWFELAEEAIEDERPYPRDNKKLFARHFDQQVNDNMRGKLSVNDIKRRKLSAIYQFAIAMPMLFVPTLGKNAKEE